MTLESITAFAEQMENMQDPRKRRGFVDSFYARLVHGKLNDERTETIELAADLVGKYLSPAHAKKLKYLSFKESLKLWGVEKEVIERVSRDDFQKIRDGIFRDIGTEGDSVLGNPALVEAIIYENMAKYGTPPTPDEELCKRLKQVPRLV